MSPFDRDHDHGVPYHPPIGGYPGYGGYDHPMWGAVATGVVLAQQAINADQLAQAQRDTNMAIAQAQLQQNMVGSQVKAAMATHLATAQQILATLTPTTVDTAAASMHITAAQQLLPQA